jgi:hypothetical protein
VRRAKKSPQLSSHRASGFFLLSNGTHAGKQRVTAGRRPAPPFCLWLSCQGLQIRAERRKWQAAGGEALGGRADAGVGLTPDSSASWAELWLQTAPHPLTPGCPAQQSGERQSFFRVLSQPGSQCDEGPKNSAPKYKHHEKLGEAECSFQSSSSFTSPKMPLQGVEGTALTDAATFIPCLHCL